VEDGDRSGNNVGVLKLFVWFLFMIMAVIS